MLVLTYQSTQAQHYTHKVPSRSLRAHRDTQHYNSYPEWRRKQPRLRRQAARASLKQHKRIIRYIKRNERLLKYEGRLRTRIIRTR
jgi:hypothetical protein